MPEKKMTFEEFAYWYAQLKREWAALEIERLIKDRSGTAVEQAERNERAYMLAIQYGLPDPLKFRSRTYREGKSDEPGQR